MWVLIIGNSTVLVANRYVYDNQRFVALDSNPSKTLAVRWVSGLELPKLNSAQDRTIRKTGFTFLYNEAHEQAAWVAYQLTKSETRGFIERTDNFREDPSVKTGSATSADYQGTGYDRGHLAPAGDMGWSTSAMSESFFYSNMSPQVPAFNRGIWKRLEEKVRLWAMDYDTLYVVTGPVLTADLPQIGPNRVSVPRYFYKVLLDFSEPELKGIGFVMPNLGSKLPLQHYTVSIDSVERLTGLDFFPELPDVQESILERSVCLSCWQWSGSNSSIGSPGLPATPKVPVSVQCSGTTQSGARCKRKTTNPNGRCYQH